MAAARPIVAAIFEGVMKVDILLDMTKRVRISWRLWTDRIVLSSDERPGERDVLSEPDSSVYQLA